ncbi:MAG: SsrA-binding protein SmpB [Elusimicrobia bacterium]|nr:SsrA-binding protein SmpB [Elusimicrobiota bacterium]
MAKKKNKDDDGRLLIAENRKARHHYEILDVLEAGLQLRGPEVKSLRARQVSFEGAFARVEKGEAFLHRLHIAPYKLNTLEELSPTRTRKLLLRKRELERLATQQDQKGMTLIPLEVYFRNGWAKVALAVGRGKRGPDKRDTLRRKDAARDLERSFKGKFKA